MALVVWITGLPGSGKSTVSSAVKREISDLIILRMDELRAVVTPEPAYTDSEREYTYRALVFTAKTLYEAGHNVVVDATAHRQSWRNLARQLIPDFIEVYLRCPAHLCIEREKARVVTHAAPEKIYEKGRAGWPVPGVNVPYEEPERPELIIDTENDSPGRAAEKIALLINKIQGEV